MDDAVLQTGDAAQVSRWRMMWLKWRLLLGWWVLCLLLLLQQGSEACKFSFQMVQSIEHMWRRWWLQVAGGCSVHLLVDLVCCLNSSR